MDYHDIIVVGASAGGVEALQKLVRELPGDLPAALFIVLHMPADSPSILSSILDRASLLPCVQASDHEIIQRGHIYVARPDHHLLVHEGHMRVVAGPKENRARPAIDPLFRSAAAAYGSRVVGVVLTGLLDDGTAGLLAIQKSGGVTMVQNPTDALFPNMPQNAMDRVRVDYCLPLADIPATLARLVAEPAAQGVPPPPITVAIEAKIAEGHGQMEDLVNISKPSMFSCPECGGVLWESNDKDLLRFRCQVGHAYSSQALQADQEETLEEALWVALRILEERAELDRRIVDDARKRAMNNLVPHFEDRARQAEQHAETIRRILTGSTSQAKAAPS